jgi:hypothetical protein
VGINTRKDTFDKPIMDKVKEKEKEKEQEYVLGKTPGQVEMPVSLIGQDVREAGLSVGTPFIQTSERPTVGESVLQAADERSSRDPGLGQPLE